MDVTPADAASHLARIESSSTFGRAERLTRFLRFIVEETLAGRSGGLKEYSIAVEVFGRPPSYDPQVDSLVRVQASQLRARLRRYYETEGSAEPFRIEVPKGGYAPVFHHVGPPARQRPNLAAIGWAAALTLAIAGVWLLLGAHLPRGNQETPTSVAVLPFVDLSPSRDQAYLCDGLAEDLIQSLGHIPGLRVVARTSAFQYKDRSSDVRRIGEALNVHFVLEGSVRRDGPMLRVTAQLINTADGYEVWSSAYERQLDDTFAVEEEIARLIAGHVGPERSEARRARATAPDPAAYQHYLTGVYWRTNPSAEHLRKAIAEFRAAIAADPRYTQAQAAMAEAFAKLYYTEVAAPAETVAPAKAAAARALELDGQLGRAHEASALVHLIDWDLAGAEREFRRALQIDPADVRLHYAYAQLCLNPAGRHQEAIEQLRYSLQFDPVARYLITELGATYLMSGQFARAREEFRRSLGLNPNAAGTRTNLAATDSAEGRYREAIATLEKVDAELPGDPWVEGHLGYAYAKAGRTVEARRVLDALTRGKAVPALHIAAVWVGLGETDRALDWLDRGLASHAPSMYCIG